MRLDRHTRSGRRRALVSLTCAVVAAATMTASAAASGNWDYGAEPATYAWLEATDDLGLQPLVPVPGEPRWPA
jgi:Rieske Fe-S protein